MSTKLFLTIALVVVLTSVQHNLVATGFTITPLSPARFGGATTASSTTETAASTRRPVTVLSMANDDELDERKKRQRNQQLGAAALLLFGALYDFFITHHGVGIGDPNYVI